MLYIIYRCVRSRLRQFVQLFLLIGWCLTLGFGSGQERHKQERPKGERLVSVKLTDGTGEQNVLCGNFQRGQIFNMIRAQEAEKAGKNHYEFPVFDGELMMVSLSGKAGKLTYKMSFPYIFRGDEKTPLVFSYRPGLMLLNGEVVCVDLGGVAGFRWMSKQPDARLKTIRTLLLSGDPATDTVALTRMAGSGITIALSKKKSENKSAKSSPTAKARVRRAMIAAKPVCLFADRMEVDEDMIVQLSDITHLMISSLTISGDKMSDLTKLKKLRWLGYFDGITNLAPLAKLTHLQGLWLERCDNVADFTPLRKLNHLQTLFIGKAEKLTDLHVFADMRNLRSLAIPLDDEGKIKSIVPIAKLTNLTELALAPIPPTVKDLSPLKKLKKLQILVVDSDGLKERKKEYDEIRKALPDCQIVGFCMGSAWILVVVPMAVGLGFWRRRRSATGKAT